jgi:hypothetical protein
MQSFWQSASGNAFSAIAPAKYAVYEEHVWFLFD